MEYLLLLLAFPVIWPFIAKKIWPHEISWVELAINVVGVMVIVTGVWFAGKYGATTDLEIWNGAIVSKERKHDSYIESYSCNCYQSCSGSGSNRSCHQVCQTCYRTHYTVDWFAMADFGGSPYKIRLDYEDRLSRSVYKLPDPPIYSNCQPGEPASIEQTYTNFVQAVPDSLFNTKFDEQLYADKIPTYPRVYGKYRVNRVINVDSPIQSFMITDLNTRLNNSLKTLGPRKQANVIVIVTDIDDSSYRHVVENAWIGGKQNDVVVFLGVDGEQLTWTDVMTFALNKGNELFHVTLRDRIIGVGKFDAEQLTSAIETTIVDHFDRIDMSEFQYLEDQIQPANWVIILALILAVGGSIGTSFIMRIVDIGDYNRYGRYRRFR